MTQSIDKNLRLILAAKTDGLPVELNNTTQFREMTHELTIATLESAGLWYGPRPVLEETEAYRQIIPYIVLQYGDKYMRYTRTAAGEESRLHGRTSIGLGGHVDLSDVATQGEYVDLGGTLANAARRELREEVGEVLIDQQNWVGLMVENSSAVGRVHIGIIGVWQLQSLPSSDIEDAIGNIQLVTLEDLYDDGERLEGWSARLLPYLASLR